MPLQVRLAPATPALRCAACHDDLDEPRVVCGACGVALHPECSRGLERCPTLGCGVRRRPTVARPVAPAAQASSGLLLWFGSGTLACLWPLLLTLYLALVGSDGRWPSPITMLFSFVAAVSTGSLIGHFVLAPRARRLHGEGPHRLNAFFASLLGFVGSLVWLAIGI